MEFIHTARELRLYTTRKCAGFPKRYTFTVANSIAEVRGASTNATGMANSIYLINEQEIQASLDGSRTSCFNF